MAVIERRPFNYQLQEDSDIAFLEDLNHKFRVATVFTASTFLVGATIYVIENPLVRLGVQGTIFFGCLAAVYKITSSTFST